MSSLIVSAFSVLYTYFASYSFLITSRCSGNSPLTPTPIFNKMHKLYPQVYRLLSASIAVNLLLAS